MSSAKPTVLTEAPESLGPVKMVKIQQTESGPFNVSNNLCSIEFDGENVTDLSRSYLDLSLKLTLPNGQVVPDCTLGDLATEAKYMGSCFVKTATLRSEKVGIVEQFRYQNVHSETMKQFLKYSQEEDAADILNSGDVKVDENGEAHVIVPLKDILGCAKSPFPYPNNRMGPSTLQLEFENVKPVAYTKADDIQASYELAVENEAQQADPWVWTELTLTQKFRSQADAELYFLAGDKTAVLNYDMGGELTTNITIENVTVDVENNGVTTITFSPEINIEVATPVTDITLSKVVDGSLTGVDIDGDATDDTNVSKITFENCATEDFTIGTTLFVGWFQQTAAGIQPNDSYSYAYGVIVDAEVNADDETSVDVTFEDTVFTILAGFNATQIQSFVDITPQQLQWEISEVDLVLVKPIKQFEVPQYEFQCMNLEMVNLPAGVPFFRRQFELETTCDRVLLLNPVDTLVAVKQFGAYRNALNNIQTTTQDVVIDQTNNASLYYDRWLTAVDDIKRLQYQNGGLQVVGIPEAVVPQAVGLPNNVMEFQLMEPVAGGVQSSMLYCYKRITKMF